MFFMGVPTHSLDCFRQVVAKEGVRGLYRGIVPNLVGITPEKAIKLAVNDFAREYWAQRTNVSEEKLAIQYGMLSGATAGLCQVIATNPMEIVKIQMQVAGGQKLAPGEQRPTAMGIVRSLGLRGLYRGTPATLLRYAHSAYPVASTRRRISNLLQESSVPNPMRIVPPFYLSF